jgi:hypothetical protein
MPALRTADTSRESWTQGRTKRGTLDAILDILKSNIDGRGMIHVKSNGSKVGWGGCCLLCSAAVVAVVLVVVPIAVFVILPIVGQHMLDSTSIVFPTSVVMPCSNSSSVFFNSALVNFAGSFSSELQAHEATLSVSSLGMSSSEKGTGKCAAFNSTEIGSYMSPEVRLVSGATRMEFTATMQLSNATLFKDLLIAPMFTDDCQVMLSVNARDVTMVVFGVKLGGLKIKSQMFCSPQTTPLQDLHDESRISHCASSPKEMAADRRLEAPKRYAMHCTDAVQRNLTLVV